LIYIGYRILCRGITAYLISIATSDISTLQAAGSEFCAVIREGSTIKGIYGGDIRYLIDAGVAETSYAVIPGYHSLTCFYPVSRQIILNFF
jgi:hypothetical protein